MAVVDGAPDSALGLLRPALELALGVARQGAVATPVVPPPRSLRPILRHAKLSGRALSTVRDAVEADDDYRDRVAAEATEAALGPLAYAWLTRRDGWAEDLRNAVDEKDAAADAHQEERAERHARRRLQAAEERRAAAEAQAGRAREAAADAEAQLAQARQERRAADDERRVLTGSLEAMAQTVADLEEALGEATQTRQLLGERLGAAERQVEALGHERDDALARAARAERAAAAARGRADERDEDDLRVRSALGRAIDDAAGAAQALGIALASAAGVLGGPGPDPPPPSRPVAGPAGRPPAARRPVPPGSGRRATALPPAVFDDSVEAATFLASVPGMVLAVDGYNVSLLGWADSELAHQRRALVDRLISLAARTGNDVRVFFDGAEDHEMPPPRGRARDAVRVTFSAAGTDADEDIIAFVEHLPASEPVTVATSDRRVAREVATRGANVVSSAQLLAVLGRDPAR